jgi:phosphatidylserine/phosphatidylglycerophosphate/cardiolipin synthase-like enzyme
MTVSQTCRFHRDHIVTSLNLYEFSQVNNNEMGILLRRSEDAETYKDAYEEALRIIRVSDEVRVSLERIVSEPEAEDGSTGKLTTSKLAKKLGKSTDELLDALTASGHLKLENDKHVLTKMGEEAGANFIAKGRFGAYFLWPETLLEDK